MKLKDLDKYLKELLKPELYRDFCTNGLNIEGSQTVNRIVTGVSFSIDLVQEAIQKNANCIIVHHPHGLWDNEARMPVGALAKKLKLMMRHNISLFAFHLPLDGHPEVGNNVGIAQALGCNNYGTFINAGQADVGLLCKFSQSLNPLELREKITAAFGKTGVQHALLYGEEKINIIAISSGASSGSLLEAKAKGAQALLTGELKENAPIQAREEAMHLFGCGHHRTEVFGPRALGQRIQTDLGVEVVFVDIPNPV
ncbi:MAG: Nif3-like dinuclear metal center hexameric protein [Fibrobacter sp.]|nr:Nif3-like dinuclear metal center hexameric protein [Fibrobacter sp.]